MFGLSKQVSIHVWSQQTGEHTCACSFRSVSVVCLTAAELIVYTITEHSHAVYMCTRIHTHPHYTYAHTHTTHLHAPHTHTQHTYTHPQYTTHTHTQHTYTHPHTHTLGAAFLLTRVPSGLFESL